MHSALAECNVGPRLEGDLADPDQLLTASDAGRILGLSRDMVRILSRKGELAALRAANGYHLFKRKDVEALARKRAKRLASRQRRHRR